MTPEKKFSVRVLFFFHGFLYPEHPAFSSLIGVFLSFSVVLFGVFPIPFKSYACFTINTDVKGHKISKVCTSTKKQGRRYYGVENVVLRNRGAVIKSRVWIKDGIIL